MTITVCYDLEEDMGESHVSSLAQKPADLLKVWAFKRELKEVNLIIDDVLIQD